MVLNVANLNIPPILPKVEWDLLFELVKLNPIGIDVSQSYFNAVPHWTISETLNDFKFIIHRNKATKQRITEIDSLGLIGFSTINPKDPRVYLTEGVSDFITVKLTHSNMNVLGLTTLSGSNLSKKIITTLFNKICIVSDNDIKGYTNTGVSNATRMARFYKSLGKQVKVIVPDTGFKDITDQFIYELNEVKN